jgi:hypothetical protein
MRYKAVGIAIRKLSMSAKALVEEAGLVLVDHSSRKARENVRGYGGAPKCQ